MLKTGQALNQIRLKSDPLIGLVLKASICHKSKLPPQKNSYRWPYEKRGYGFGNFFLDPFTKNKFTENTKIIQIDGNIECGKEDFGRRLADQLGMHYMPPVDLESYYVNDFGFDYRALNLMLPERLRLCDWEMFHECPNRHSVVHLQYIMFKLRLYQYVLALQHLFNTGQGVVINRSVFTEKILVDAMHEVGWLPMGYLREDGVQFYDYKNRYDHTRNVTLSHILTPHLTIYLDTPVDVCMDRIKNSSDPLIANSNAHVPEFLEAFERASEDVLSRQENFGHVLQFEYPKRATNDEILDVVDEIENLNFELDDQDTRFSRWDDQSVIFFYFSHRRIVTSSGILRTFNNVVQPWFDIAGLGDSITTGDLALRDTLYQGQVQGVGHYVTKQTDIKYNLFGGLGLDLRPFGQRFRTWIYNDYT